MSLVYEMSPSCDQVRVIGTGNITTRDCVHLIEEVLADPRCRPDSTAIVDIRDAIYKPKDLAEVLDIASKLASFRNRLNGNIAIVAKQSTLFAAEILSAQIRNVTGIGMRVFVDHSAAEAFCAETQEDVACPGMARKHQA